MIMKMSRELQGDNHEDEFNEYFDVFRMIYRITKRTKELEPMMNGDEEKENFIHDEYTRPEYNQRRHSMARTIPARLLRTSHDSR